MPRLLLVDDNPSIHKIAETLLAATDVHLTCASSGAEALALIEQGGAFDVALLDTSMMTMDGWELLERLRALDATARIPVAMMAGVLDVVDPERISQAPIQGFLKKPVELRDLGDRIKRLLETPVPPPPAKPEPEPEPEPEPISPFLTQPGFRIADHPELQRTLETAGSDDDLLLLGPEDLYRGDAEPEPARLIEPAALQAMNDTLDLEELDIDSLRGLSLQPEQPLVTFEETETFKAPEAFSMGGAPEDTPTVEEIPALSEYGEGDAFPSPQDMDEGNSVTTGELPDLGPERPAPAPIPDSELFDWSDDSDSLVPPASETTQSIALSDILEQDAAASAEAPAEAEDGLDLDLISDVLLTSDLGLASDPTTHLGEFELPEPSEPSYEPLGGRDPRADTGKIAGFRPEDFLPPATEPVEAATTLEEAGFIVEPEFPAEPETLEASAELAEPAFLDELKAAAEAGIVAETEAEPEFAAEAEPEFVAEAEAEPEVPAEVEAEPEFLAQAEPEVLVESEAQAEPEFAPAPEPFAEVAALPEPEPPVEAAFPVTPLAVPALPEAHSTVVGAAQPGDALAALLADPVLMDQLARAVVARLGEQALREIAWEIMPELADRLHRN